MNRIVIPAECAVSIELKKDQRCRIVNTEGGQVVDTWAFNADNFDEYLSMEHSRSANYKLLFKPGDSLVSNFFQPMFTLTNDTSPGYHDTLHAACSVGSNRFYRSSRLRPNCQDNLINQMDSRGYVLTHIPCPWNLFEHALVESGSKLVDEPSAATPGDYVELEASMDLIMICSACPSLVGQISGSVTRGAAVDVF